MRSLLFLLAALAASAQTTRVIGYAQDGKTPIEARIAANYNGTGGTLVIAGLDGARGTANADVVIALANPLKATLQFPPTGVPYKEHAESWALWRWIQFHAPREITIQGADPSGLKAALAQAPPAASANRTAQEVAQQYAAAYGHDFNQLTYLPGMALIGQMRLGNVDAVAKLAEPYLTRDTLNRASSLTLAGHMVFGELAKRTKDARYIALVKKVGDLGFDESGAMRDSMPLHGEMSDSLFMAGPITAMAGSLTGDRKYFGMVAQHFRFMQKLTLRADGLYRHSPLVDTAWSRGNAFPALGMALALSEFPQDHPDRDYILGEYRKLMAMLARYQDADGMWHEIIDEPGSYPETSATAMIATAMLRGVRQGWLDASYQARVDRAWKAVLLRTYPDGTLLDVCESTNKMPTREDYLYRAPSTGKDERGGGMMLLFATEMAGLR
jgi:unsaturated rhamnogalacturonyl hydrolase